MRRIPGLNLLQLPLILTLLLPAPGALAAQSAATERYLDHAELTREVRALASRHSNLISVDELVRTDQGREVWRLTLAAPGDRDPDSRPALLVVANLEGNHLVGSNAALHLAEHLASGYGEVEEIPSLLDRRTVYILPRMNPDGAELVWTMPEYEIPYKPHPLAPDQGGLNIRELGRDLSGNGRVQLMRVPDPTGSLIPDADEPRLSREANRARAERGLFTLHVEGIDPANAEAYVAMGSDGVNLNRNFPHEYLPFQPHVGPHQVSEVETRALADFMFDQVNIAAVITFSPYDNLRSAPPAQRTPPQGVAPGPPSVPTNILGDDRPFYEYVAERFTEITGLTGDGEEGEAGSFPQYAYYQVGLPSWTTPVWTLPGEGGSGGGAGAAPGGASSDPVGAWAVQTSVEGQPLDATLTVTREGQELSGVLDSPAGSVQLSGSGQAGRFQLSGDVPQMGTISVSGTVTGNDVSGSLGLGPMGSAAFTGTRAGSAGAGAAPVSRARGATRDHRWLAYFDEMGIDGFTEWTPAEHPELGQVEVGGFVPNARVNPPEAMLEDLARRHSEFAVWLGHQLPEVEIEEVTVEPRGDHVYQISATVVNDQYLPTHLQMGVRIRTNRPITARLLPTDGMAVLTGNIQQQVPRIHGMGGRHTFTWLVQAAPGTRIPMELFAERAGGLQSTTITLP